MGERTQVSRRRQGEDPMPLDVLRTAFGLLTVGPAPLAIDGRQFAGLPARAVPLSEVRDRLLARSCPQRVRDAVWFHLIARSRERGEAWTVGCAGIALPALTRIAATLTARFAGDPRDVHAAVLAGFLAELTVVDVGRPRIMLRLRWAAYRAGHAAVRDALDAPVPSGHAFTSTAPPAPGGHPDLVLARAVDDRILTRGEAALIGSTRLEDVSLAAAAAARGAGYEATKKARQRAEQRLAAYLLAEANTAEPEPDNGPAPRASHEPSRTTAGRNEPTHAASSSPTVSDAEEGRAQQRGRVRRVRQRPMSPNGGVTGVQGRGSTPVPAEPTPTPLDADANAEARSGSRNAEVPRCA
jgi:hypothetical protein